MYYLIFLIFLLSKNTFCMELEPFYTTIKLLHTLQTPQKVSINSILALANNDSFLAINENGEITKINSIEGSLSDSIIPKNEHGYAIKDQDNKIKTHILHNNKEIISGSCCSQTISSFDITSEKTTVIANYCQLINTLLLSNSLYNNCVITGACDNTVKVWDMRAGKCVATFYGHTDCVNQVIEGNNSLISCSNDCTIKEWDPRKISYMYEWFGQYKKSWHGNNCPIRSLAFGTHHKDKTPFLYAGDDKGIIRRWTHTQNSYITDQQIATDHFIKKILLKSNVLFSMSDYQKKIDLMFSTGSKGKALEDHQSHLTAIHMSDNHLVSADANGTILVRKIE